MSIRLMFNNPDKTNAFERNARHCRDDTGPAQVTEENRRYRDQGRMLSSPYRPQ